MTNTSLPQSRTSVKQAYRPNRKAARNEELYSDYMRGWTRLDLCLKYRVSTQRVSAIIDYMEKLKLEEVTHE